MSPTPPMLADASFTGRIGVARGDITPPVGIHSRTWGSAVHEVAEGVHRPLFATCLSIESAAEGEALVLVTLDALVFWSLGANRIREAVEKKFGLKREQVIFHPSHSHSTPFLDPRHLDKPGGDLIQPYLDSMPALLCGLIESARKAARPATLCWRYGRCGLAVNRDAIDPGTGRDICGLNPEQPADDTLLIGRVTDDHGEILATLVNYACHPVSLGGGNRLLSPDYVGAMRELIERETDQAPCLFLHGASGDLTPRRSYESTTDAAEQNGRELGYAALATLAGMFPAEKCLQYEGIEESGTALGRWRLHPRKQCATTLEARAVGVPLRLRPMPTRVELEARLTTARERFEVERLERSLARRLQVGDADTHEFGFTLWQIGEAFLVSTPAEPYSRFQIDLRTRFPGVAIAVLNLSDGTTTYLPRPSAFERDVYQSRIAFYEPESLEIVTGAAIGGIESMLAAPARVQS